MQNCHPQRYLLASVKDLVCLKTLRFHENPLKWVLCLILSGETVGYAWQLLLQISNVWLWSYTVSCQFTNNPTKCFRSLWEINITNSLMHIHLYFKLPNFSLSLVLRHNLFHRDSWNWVYSSFLWLPHLIRLTHLAYFYHESPLAFRTSVITLCNLVLI